MTLQTQPLPAMPARSRYSRAAMLAVVASLAIAMAHDADARGRSGGGFRGGSAMSAGRTGGFAGRTSLQRPTNGARRPQGQSGQRPSGQRSGTAAGTFSGGGNANTANAGSGNTGFAGGGNGNSATAAANGNTGVAGNGNTRVVGRGNGNGSGNVGSGNVNNGNVAVGNDVDIDVDNGGWNGPYDYPVATGAAYATGVAVGTTATAAAIGSYYSSLPAGCSPYTLNGYRYYTCSGAWYQQTYRSGSTVYVVIDDPTR